MIHFRCKCGRTLSADEGRAGSTIRCEGCAENVAVPRAVANASKVVRNGAREAIHDFDAEIVDAVRAAPPRALKTPSEAVHVVEEQQAADREPEFDLLAVRQASSRLSRTSWAALVVLAGASLPALLLAPWNPWMQGIAALVLLTLAGTVFLALRALAQVCRSVDGLARRQRELAEQIRKDRDAG